MLLKLITCAVLKLKVCAVKVLHYMKGEHIMNTLHYVPFSTTQKIKLKRIFERKIWTGLETGSNVVTVTKF